MPRQLKLKLFMCLVALLVFTVPTASFEPPKLRTSAAPDLSTYISIPMPSFLSGAKKATVSPEGEPSPSVALPFPGEDKPGYQLYTALPTEADIADDYASGSGPSPALQSANGPSEASGQSGTQTAPALSGSPASAGGGTYYGGGSPASGPSSGGSSGPGSGGDDGVPEDIEILDDLGKQALTDPALLPELEPLLTAGPDDGMDLGDLLNEPENGTGAGGIAPQQVTPVPEPASLGLVGIGLAAIAAHRKKKKN